MKSFNTYFNKYFDYKSTEEREILTEIYTNKNKNELCQVITLLKHSVFPCKIHINTVLFGDKILLLLSVLHLEDIPTNTVKQLVRDIKKRIHSPNIKVVNECLTEGDYMSRRCVEFAPNTTTAPTRPERNSQGLGAWF